MPGSPPPDLAGFRRQVKAHYRKRGRDLPWRRMRDPYAILVSAVLSTGPKTAGEAASLAACDRGLARDVLEELKGEGFLRRKGRRYAIP